MPSSMPRPRTALGGGAGLALALLLPCCASRADAPPSAAAPSRTTCPPLAASASSSAPIAAPPRQVIEGTHAGGITDLVFSPSGRWLATSGSDGTVRVWDPVTLHELVVARPGGSPRLTWLPGETAIVAAIEGFQNGFQHFGAVRIDVARGESKPLAFPRDLYRIVRVTWSDGTRWVGSSYDDVRRFDEEGRELGVLAAKDPSWRPRHASLEVSEDGITVRIQLDQDGRGPFDGNTRALAWEDGAARDPAVIEPRFERPLPGERERISRAVPGLQPSSVARSRDGHRLFVGGTRSSARGEIALVSLDTAGSAAPRELRFPDLGARDQWAPGGDELRPIVLSPDGTRLAAGSWEGRIWMVDARSFALLGALGGDRSPRLARDLALTSDGRLIVLAEDHVSTFSLTTGARRSSVYAPGAIRLAPDGERLGILAARDRGCLVRDGFDPARGRSAGSARCELPKLIDATTDAHKILAAAGTRALFASIDDTRIVDLSTGTSTAIGADEPRCGGPTVPAAFTPDASALVTWSYRGKQDTTTYCVFDGATGKTRNVVELPRSPESVLGRDARSVGAIHASTLTVYALPSGETRWSAPVEAGERIGAIGPEGTTVIVRRDDRIRVLREGRVTGQAAIAPEEPTPSRLDAAGRWAVAIGTDGGLRIWDLTATRHAVTLVDFRDEEWIALSPGGAYTGTSEVADRVGWVYPSPLEHFSFEQFSRTYRDPSVIAARLRGEAAEVAAAPLRPPRVALIAAPTIDRARPSIHLRARVASDTRVDWLRAFVEGRPVAERAICAASGEVDLDLPLLPGHNRIHLIGFDSRGYSSNAVTADADAPRDPSRRPDLWVVAVGVSRYPRLPAAMQLGVAHEDARAVASTLGAEEGRSYAHVHARTMIDAEATPAAIRAALAGLTAMRADDVAVVFFAGHGFKRTAAGEMVFATAQVKLDAAGTGVDPASALADTVGWAEIAEGIAGAKGRVVVLLDACHAGHVSQDLIVPNAAMAADLARSGRAGAVVFAAAKGRQLSLEPDTSRGLELDVDRRALVEPKTPEPHGFFTGALLNALEDPTTDRDGSGAIELGELIDEVTRRVSRASGGAQTPWVARRELFGDFGLVERRSR